MNFTHCVKCVYLIYYKSISYIYGISTGGTSPNIVKALTTANKRGCKTIGFSGKNGGEFNALCDVNLLVNSNDTPRIQEMHILIGHTICHLIEQEFS